MGAQSHSLRRSEVVTFNGGVVGSLPPGIVGTTSARESTVLTVEARGVGLASATTAFIVAADTSWQIPLAISASTDTTLTASADVPASLSDAVLQVTVGGSTMSAEPLEADATCGPVSFIASEFGPSSFFKYRLFFDPDPQGDVDTKDFAFYENVTKVSHRRLYHLIYIRHHETPPASGNKEPSLGHAWSEDLKTWRVDTTTSAFFPAGGSAWDAANVWAPSLIQYGDSTYMFYTGVSSAPNSDQRIGFATTFDLDTCNTVWNRRPTFVLSVDSLSWASSIRLAPANLGQQLRDPYVFAHPNPDSASAGKFFMVFTALPQDRVGATPHDTSFAMGIARNRTAGSLERWISTGYYHTTDGLHTKFNTLEGPHLFHDRKSSTGWWSMFSNANGGCSHASEDVRFERQTAGADPWNTDSTLWQSTSLQSPDTLFRYLVRSVPGRIDSTAWGWQGTEHLVDLDGEREYLAGFTAFGQPRPTVCQNGKTGIAIAQLFWRSPSNGAQPTDFVLDTLDTGPPGVTAVDEVGSPTARVQMAFVEFRPRASRVSWRISVPGAMPVTFNVYDVAGRHRRTLLDTTLPRGSAVVTWDTADEGGGLVRSGMYYVRLNFRGGTRTAVVPVVR
jgi:hypothetical protein